MASSGGGKARTLADYDGVWDVTPLAGFPDVAAARALLQRVAEQVRPLMAARRWRLPALREFFPADPALAGMNVGGGAEIYLRLRPAGAKGALLPYDGVLATLLHELAHNVRGPHDDVFYEALDGLTREMQEGGKRWLAGDAPSRASGTWAPGSDGSSDDGSSWTVGGARPGGGSGGQRAALAAAAERRATYGRIAGPPGGRVLGSGGGGGGGRSSSSSAAAAPAQVPTSVLGKRALLAAAAERRARDDHECANGFASGSHGGAAKAAPPSAAAPKRARLGSSGGDELPQRLLAPTAVVDMAGNGGDSDDSDRVEIVADGPVQRSSGHGAAAAAAASSSSSSAAAARLPPLRQPPPLRITVIVIDDDGNEVTGQILGPVPSVPTACTET
jgi:hypothetical protein